MTTSEAQHLADLLDDMPIAMLTTHHDGTLRSVPMGRQATVGGDELWFITGRSTLHVQDIERDPEVGLTFSGRSSWVSVTGSATVVDDSSLARELWDTYDEAWMPEGPDSPEVVLLRVEVERGEYWDAPGSSAVSSLLSFAKAKLTGSTLDTDHGSVGGDASGTPRES